MQSKHLNWLILAVLAMAVVLPLAAQGQPLNHAPQAQSATHVVRVENRHTEALTHLFASPATEAEFRLQNLLAEPLPPGGKVGVELPREPGQCLWDFLAQYYTGTDPETGQPLGQEVTIRLDLCHLVELIIGSEGADPSQPALPPPAPQQPPRNLEAAFLCLPACLARTSGRW